MKGRFLNGTTSGIVSYECYSCVNSKLRLLKQGYVNHFSIHGLNYKDGTLSSETNIVVEVTTFDLNPNYFYSNLKR